MVRDPIFGPVIMFGMGGVLVEALKDIAFRVLPLTEGDIEDMVRETLGFSLLRGYRGKPAANLEGLYEVLRKVAQLAEQHPDITEIDLNPVIAHPEAVTVVDSRIIVAP